MFKLVLVRHGESIWNKENLFTGWTDIDLSKKGKAQAKLAADELQNSGLTFDMAFASYLKRSIRFLWILLDSMDLMWIPVYKSWCLNERFYGALQGLHKKETSKKYGEEQVKLWRRSYSSRPPAIKENDPRFPGNELKYSGLSKSDLPLTESLKDAAENRIMPYWYGEIAPKIKSGSKIIIAAHGNSLRGLIKHLDNLSDDETINLNIPLGIPLIYELDINLKPLKHYYLGDIDKINKAIENISVQHKL